MPKAKKDEDTFTPDAADKVHTLYVILENNPGISGDDAIGLYIEHLIRANKAALDKIIEATADPGRKAIFEKIAEQGLTIEGEARAVVENEVYTMLDAGTKMKTVDTDKKGGFILTPVGVALREKFEAYLAKWAAGENA